MIKREPKFIPVYSDDPALNSKYIQDNEETLKIAEEIQRQRENELRKPEIYSGFELEQLRKIGIGEENFVDYFRSMAEKRTGLNHDNWMATLNYLESFTSGKLRFTDLNEYFCNNFRDHLLTTQSNKSSKTNLSVNSASSYFGKFKAALKQAYSDGKLLQDLNSKIKTIKQQDTRKSFLTLEELNKLAKSECNNPVLKRAAIFSALTGLRFSDIHKLTWSELDRNEEQGFYIRFTQKKTNEYENLPISEQAYNLLGEPGEPENKVFQGLQYSACSSKHFYQWLGSAGITKDITFHSMRHTRATLLLSKGTDIYTVSKMLGHRNVKTTQVYAKVIDQAKRDAADKIQLDL
jgi:integrase